MKKTRILCLALVLVLCVAVLSACKGDQGSTSSGDNSGENHEIVLDPAYQLHYILSQDKYGTDYVNLYDYLGEKTAITIDMVSEDSNTGLAYIEYEGTKYELGMDFLSMAMVYNVDVPDGGKWKTEDDVYATWWKYYITRWNYLLPEVPLYSNEYYDVYNAQIKGVTDHPTNPYWDPASALIDWSSDKSDKSIILGNSTELSGRLRAPSWGVSSPGAGDLNVNNLITGLETVSTTKEGGYVVNDTVVKDLAEKDNDDGSHTYTITIYDDLKFSDGSAITAKNYVAYVLMASTEASVQAGGTGQSGMNFVGFNEFRVYDGTNDGQDAELVDEDGEVTGTYTASKIFKGIHLVDDYTFEVTVDSAFYPYYYAITYAGFSPYPIAQWLGEADVADDGDGVYLTDKFYEKNGDEYTVKAAIEEGVWNTTDKFAFSGPYMIEGYDEATHTATLVINPEFKGNYEGTKPKIERVVYKRIISETQLQDLQSGGVDVLSGITGGDATNEALALVDAEPDKYVATHYARAGYGKLGFRGDLGPVRFLEVRQAIAYCLDRATFAKDFTGGYGGVTDGPYYTGAWMYQAAMKDGMVLSQYPTSVDTAIALLESAGWNYNADGSAYSGTGVRYKKLAANEIDAKELTYASKDGAYKVEKVGDDYYMPLVINWYGTTDNEFSNLLVTGFMENDNIKAAGFVVQNTLGDFNPMLDELYQGQLGVSYNGVPTYNAFNFATGFTSAAYDYSWNWRIDPTYFEYYSVCYIRDAADAVWLGAE